MCRGTTKPKAALFSPLLHEADTDVLVGHVLVVTVEKERRRHIRELQLHERSELDAAGRLLVVRQRCIARCITQRIAQRTTPPTAQRLASPSFKRLLCGALSYNAPRNAPCDACYDVLRSAHLVTVRCEAKVEDD